ncbi:MAG: prepilin-type N-terminal cleavage/methylation domain-containing protein [Pirellulales bacterium]
MKRDLGLGTGDWGLKATVACGLAVGARVLPLHAKPQAAIFQPPAPSPQPLSGASSQPPAPSPQPRRRGISLTEVLISMGLLAIGLLGVAAMFPVGSYYLLKGEISDRGSAAAQAAFSDLVNRGMLQPEAWMMGNSTSFWNESLPKRYWNATAMQRATFPHSTWGSVYVLDPLGVMSAPTTAGYTPPVVSQFPIVNVFNFTCTGANSPSWQPWNYATKRYPIRRVTLNPMLPLATPAERQRAGLIAEQLFYSQDDLAIELPEQNDRPGQVRWDATGTTRAYDGHYSWIATVSPTTYAATVGLWAGSPGASLYDVSVAVFHRRPVSEPAAERQVLAAVISSGTSGGQLLLTRFPPPQGSGGTTKDTSATTPFEHLKLGQYVTLYGPHPQGNNAQPFLFFQWYRVVSIEGEGQNLNEEGVPQTNPQPLDRRIVTLRGPDWPWLPAANVTTGTLLSNDLRVGIYNGAVAVHTKTMRLSGGANSGSAWATAPTIPPTIPRKYGW